MEFSRIIIEIILKLNIFFSTMFAPMINIVLERTLRREIVF
jgi:hypothetical protein